MIYRLQRRFVLISTVSVLTVILLVFATIVSLTAISMNRNLDVLADTVFAGGGRFPPSFDGGHTKEEKEPPPKKQKEFDFITPETPFSTRHFTVSFDAEGNVTRTHTDSIYSITKESAVDYARRALKNGDNGGWISHYRYKIFSADAEQTVVFIDGSTSRSALWQTATISGLVLLGCAALVLLLILLLSRRAVTPIAESYEKQKQFITDANHELKTPLTLILANLDIAESELGKNEWLDDIRTEGQRMAALVHQLVALSRMDEDRQHLQSARLSLSDAVSDAASAFRTLAERRGLTLTLAVEPGVEVTGDEELLRRLLSILLDNAVKYCDDGGEITVTLKKKRRVLLTVENTYREVGELELHRLFDRFYRADKARTYAGGYGIGLSLAKAIVQKHRGEILAYKKDAAHIGFRVTL
ncbi:MAG: HAMP domain-containing histidine kinase [Clostridia bacterium]|nr:HAMP domain-containing histidine kinase [Clostridia bacterium]